MLSTLKCIKCLKPIASYTRSFSNNTIPPNNSQDGKSAQTPSINSKRPFNIKNITLLGTGFLILSFLGIKGYKTYKSKTTKVDKKSETPFIESKENVEPTQIKPIEITPRYTMEEKLYLSDPNFKPQFIKINIRTPEERKELALKVQNAINGFYQSFSIFIESAKLPQVSITADNIFELNPDRSEERRVGKECTSWLTSRWSPYHQRK